MNAGQARSAPGAVSLAYGWLLDALRHGRLAPGSRLPGERDLAARIGVSRSSLRQALTRLADEGRLSAASQRGWFVSRRVVGEPPSVLQSFTEMARARGLRPSGRVLHHRERPASLDEAGLLWIAPAARVLEVRRLRAMDDVPVCVDVTVLPAARMPGLACVDLTDRSLYETLRDECGVAVARSRYAVRADAADGETATLLDLDAGAPVLVGEEVAYDAGEVPVLCGRTVYRGDAYRFEADLYRPLA